jgi:hypothetical protein
MGYVSEGWKRRVEMKIQASKVSASLTNFPVFVSELCMPQGDNEIFDADGSFPALSDGGDIRCAEDNLGNTKMPIDLVEFTRDNTPANGTCEFHTKHSSISSVSDTSFWLFWNKPGASQPADSDADGRDNVYDGSFAAVYHLGEGDSTDSGFYKDATSNSNHGTLTDSDGDSASGQGKLGGASDGGYDFNGDDDFIAMPTTGNLDDNFALMTISMWIKTDDLSNNNRIFWMRSQTSPSTLANQIGITTGGAVFLHTTVGGTQYNSDILTGGGNITTGTWYWITMIWDGTNWKYYKNAGSPTTGGSHSGSITTGGTSELFRFGFETQSNQGMNGIMDEVRIHSTDRSTDWISAEHNNQNDPATFILEQTPEAIGIMNQLQFANLGADLYNGALI